MLDERYCSKQRPANERGRPDPIRQLDTTTYLDLSCFASLTACTCFSVVQSRHRILCTRDYGCFQTCSESETEMSETERSTSCSGLVF